MARASLRPEDPTRIGRYRLTARLGSGGMGVVYLGADPVSPGGSQVAVKVLRPELADDPDFRRRFRREVAALGRVKGECTVRVIEADTESARPFMVTEYADGPSLAEYIDSYGPLGSEMLYGLATGLAEALTVIHAAGIVHRDLKPSNVILTQGGPKVIDFGIARALDAVSMTRTGMMVGSAGFMAPEQVSGRPGPPADVFVWGVTVGYAAAGHSPFGTGDTNAILYRVLYSDPDIAAVPGPLRPLVEAALAKDPRSRPTADELLGRLTRTSERSGRVADSPTQTILARTWPDADAENGSLLLAPASASSAPSAQASAGTEFSDRPRPRKLGLLTAGAVSAAVLVAGGALIATNLTGHNSPRIEQPVANLEPNAVAPGSLPGYPGQQQRGVFQMINRVVSSGRTMVTTGSQTTDGVARQQFFASADGGKSWRLAPVHTPGGGQPPLGLVAARIAGGPDGWVAEGRNAIWTSPDGLSWTLAATHGITPQAPGDQVLVVNNTSGGFLAAGHDADNQAVIWTSRDGLTWQRTAAAQLGLTVSGQTAQTIQYAASRGADTVIADGGSGVWLSMNGGSAWTPVTVPVDHGASDTISGVAFDGSGLLAVRPGRTANGAPDGVAYFSQNGLAWRYAGTIDAAGGWTPGLVKGSDYGFVVVGSSAGRIVGYTSTGTAGAWLPTGSLGYSADESVPGATVGPGGTVIAVGYANATKTGQQAVFAEASTAGSVRPVSPAAIPGGLVPEMAVKSMAVADGEQIAVGSANGYPAVWRRTGVGPWTLTTPPSLVSATLGLDALTSVTHGSAGWIAAGTPGPPVILTSADGITWRPAQAAVRDLAGVASVSVAAGPAGYVIAGRLVEPDGSCLPDVWWSRNLTTWAKAHDVNGTSGSCQVLAVAAGLRGFVSAGSHDDKPAVWTNSDGRTWTTVAVPLPSGASAGVLTQVAIDGNRVVALGQQTTSAGTLPLAELSGDGGRTWRPVPFGSPGPGTAVTALTTSSGGFTAAAQFGEAGQRSAAVWTSATGSTWTRSQVSGLVGGNHEVTALGPSGSGAIGIDTIQTPPGQRFAVRALPGR